MRICSNGQSGRTYPLFTKNLKDLNNSRIIHLWKLGELLFLNIPAHNTVVCLVTFIKSNYEIYFSGFEIYLFLFFKSDHISSVCGQSIPYKDLGISLPWASFYGYVNFVLKF